MIFREKWPFKRGLFLVIRWNAIICPIHTAHKPASTTPGFRIGASDWSVQDIQSFDWLKLIWFRMFTDKYKQTNEKYFVAVWRETKILSNLKGLCKVKSLHLHRAKISINSPLKSMAHTCCL